MKKILTTIVLAASITICFAQWQQNPQRGGGPNPYPVNTRQGGNYNMASSLVVSSASQQQFSVSVDNNQYQSSVNNTINIGQLNTGNHNIVIAELRKNFWGKQVQKVIYNSSLNLRQGYETAMFINTNGQVSVSERQVYNNNNNTPKGYGNNGNGNGHGYGRDKNKHKKNHKNHDNDDCDDDKN